jgi:hypothetical protein
MDIVEWAGRVQAAFDAHHGRDPWAREAAVVAEAEADHQARMAKWKADSPKRQAAVRAWEAAFARRRAELGLGPGEQVPVMAALWEDPPERPLIW